MRNFLLISALCLSAAATSRADTVFNLVNNTFASGATATGTVNIDTAAGVFDSVNVTVLSAGSSYLFTGAPTSQTADTADNQYFEYSFDGGGNILLLDVPGTSLVGYTGGNLCSVGNLCNGLAGYFGIKVGPLLFNADPLATGSLAVATAATPEPSSLMLLGTGVLGIVGVARRRLAGRILSSDISL